MLGAPEHVGVATYRRGEGLKLLDQHPANFDQSYMPVVLQLLEVASGSVEAVVVCLDINEGYDAAGVYAAFATAQQASRRFNSLKDAEPSKRATLVLGFGDALLNGAYRKDKWPLAQMTKQERLKAWARRFLPPRLS